MPAEITVTWYVECPTCEGNYDPSDGVVVEWDVMGDPNTSILVCPWCAQQSLNTFIPINERNKQ